MSGHNRKSDAALKAQGTWRPDRHAARGEVAAAATPDPVPKPPRGMPEDEREVWAELTVAVADRFLLKFLPSFRLLVSMTANLRRLPPDAPLTARARAEQAVASMLSRWGLDPSGDANLGPLPPPEAGVQRFFRLPDGRIADESDPAVKAAIAAGTAKLVGHHLQN